MKGHTVGSPTGAVVMYPDGKEQLFNDPEAALAETDHGRVEYTYAFDSDMLPAPGSGAIDMWRYRALLPLPDGPVQYPLPIGGTPFIAPPSLRHTLRMSNLWLKDETRTPTGSNKDRATALVLEHAIRENRSVVSCASTGNVAVSLSVGAAAAGKRAVIFVPAETSPAKLKLMQLAGATVLKVVEGYDAAFKLSRQAAKEFGWYDRNTGFNPLTLEAKKTVGLEIWEQMGGEIPDVIVSPIGDGVTLAAIAKAFRELKACGVTDRLPRIIGVQAAGCQPVVTAWTSGTLIPSVEPDTLADGIAVGAPVSGPSVLRDVRESKGAFVTVEDEQMLSAIERLARGAGVLAEPAGVAAYAGLEQALEQGVVDRTERTVVLVTGSAFKNLQLIHPTGVEPREIHASIDDVRDIAKQL